MILLAIAAATAAPPPDAWFEYTLTERVTGTAGAYDGYRDQTRASGRYELVEEGQEIRVHARYRWSFEGPEGADRGEEERRTAFSPATRRYTLGPIDLDDPAFGTISPGELETWLWVDPSTPIGTPLRVLGETCVVRSSDEPVPGLSLRGPAVQCRGGGTRTDDYGEMTYTFVEDYWYHPTAGYVVGQRYTEEDQGSVEGQSGGFRRESELRLTAASYLPAGAVPARLSGDGPGSEGPELGTFLFNCGASVVAWIAGLVGLAGLLVYLSRKRKRIPDLLTQTPYGEVRVAPVTDPLALVGRDTSACTVRFGPFLEEFVARALAAGDPAWLASAEDGRVVGVAWWERASDLGSVFTPDLKVAENLVRRFKGGEAVEFFSEHRHQRAGAPAFNLHERWVVLSLGLDGEQAVDAGAVRRFRPEDRAAVAALLRAEWGGEAGEAVFLGWLDRQLERGDPAFVAVAGGQVVGFALATVSGSDGRLALAVVDRAHRDRGLGSELVRARLTALHRLGVERVIVEVADWNVAPLHVLRKAGFEEVGELFVQSSARVRRQRSVVRR